MAGHEFSVGPRESTRVYTPSLDSDDDMPRFSALDLTEKNYRLFSFRKEGRSWVNALVSESSLPEAEIKAKAKRPRKTKHGVEAQLDKMSPPRKNAIDDLLERTKRRDSDGDDWEIVAIDNDKPELTKRTGEVVAFSVILARVVSSSTKQSTKPVSQERRRSTIISPTQDFALPARRSSKSYQQIPTMDRSTRQSLSQSQTQNFRASQPILEDDFFSTTNLFAPDGKPLDPKIPGAFSSPTLPPHIPLDEPIGTKTQKSFKNKSDKRSKKSKKGDIIDLDGLVPLEPEIGDLLVDTIDIHPDQHSSDFDSPIEIETEDHDPKPRGRKRNDSGFASKTPKLSPSNTKSKSRSRRLSLHIPSDTKYTTVPVDILDQSTPRYAPRSVELPPQEKYSGRHANVVANSGRRQKPYHSSKRSSSDFAPSVHSYSDQSILEAEYEEYSSSGSSQGHEQQVEWEGGYTQPDGRYQRATRDHRRGPPSPQQGRYEPEPIPYPTSYTSSSRRPRHERFASEGAIQRYYTPASATTSRPTVLQQPFSSRYDTRTPTYSTYSHDTGLVPYPSELRRRRDSIQVRDAETYMQTQSEADKDREIEMLQRERDMALNERDLARREAELHQEVARRASVSVKNNSGGGGIGGFFSSITGVGGGSTTTTTPTTRERTSKYTHEPRLTRRYTDAYYG